MQGALKWVVCSLAVRSNCVGEVQSAFKSVAWGIAAVVAGALGVLCCKGGLFACLPSCHTRVRIAGYLLTALLPAVVGLVLCYLAQRLMRYELETILVNGADRSLSRKGHRNTPQLSKATPAQLDCTSCFSRASSNTAL